MCLLFLFYWKLNNLLIDLRRSLMMPLFLPADVFYFQKKAPSNADKPYFYGTISFKHITFIIWTIF